jgi:diguanylate cyclase (GGDEF)-like protein
MIDELTQIYNRKKLESVKDSLINQNICVILFDIDNFKHINDTYGHLKGDEVLQTLANTIKHKVRSSDLFIRWGGEEFIIILQNLSDKEIAHKLAEKLRITINEINIPEVGHFSCSFGVSCGIIKTQDDIDKILNKADELLYKAKRNGKNRVEAN